MNVKSLLRASAIAGLLAASIAPSSASAAVLQLSDTGILLGAKFVNVNGRLYDVVFEKGSCNTLYEGCKDEVMAFENQSQASDAAQALLDQVFLDGVLGNFDSDPTKTFGCTFLSNCFSRIVHQNGASSESAQAVVLNRAAGSDPDVVFTETLSADNSASSFSNVNFATFTASVPEPGTLALVGMALAGVGFARVRRT